MTGGRPEGALDCAVIAVGSELLGRDKLDTNSLRITEALERSGARLVLKCVVPDAEEEIAAALRHAAARADLLFLTGGLGPTEDDRTRAAVARWLERSIAVDEGVLAEIRAMYASRGRSMPESNRRQAEVVAGAELLPNARGVAPGQRLVSGGRVVFLLPGVPHELEGLIASAVEPWLRERAPHGAGWTEAELRTACLPESFVEELLTPAYEAWGREAVAVLARPGETRVRIRVAGRGDGAALELRERRDRLRGWLGPAMFTDAGDELETVVGALLGAAGRTLAVAESCTGGRLGGRLTGVAGSSAWFLGGVVSYSDRLKRELLGVRPETLARVGAVSKEVALEMARGARERTGADYGLAVTGIAGPGGGSAEKPVGLVHFGLIGPDGLARHVASLLPGDRERVRAQSEVWGLELLRRALAGLPELGSDARVRAVLGLERFA